MDLLNQKNGAQNIGQSGPDNRPDQTYKDWTREFFQFLSATTQYETETCQENKSTQDYGNDPDSHGHLDKKRKLANALDYYCHNLQSDDIAPGKGRT